MALHSRTICKKKTEAKIIKWLEEKTEEWHWKIELSVKKTETKILKWQEEKKEADGFLMKIYV